MFDRLMHVALVTPQSPQIGMRDALRGIAKEYIEIPWHERWCGGRIRDVRNEIVSAASRLKPNDLFFMQLQTDGILHGDLLRRIRAKKVSWGGDCRAELPTWAQRLAPNVDLMLMSNWRDVEALRAIGHAADFLQIGFSPKTFRVDGPMREGTPEIIFCGNNYPDRFSRSRFRAQMVVELQQRYGPRFSVYGNGWGASDVWLDEESEAAAYRTCKIAVSAEHYSDIPGFCSDRIFRATACGPLILSHRFVSFDDHFTNGVQAVAWEEFSDLFSKIDYYLDHDDERKTIAAAGATHTHSAHSWTARIKRLESLVGQYSKVAA